MEDFMRDGTVFFRSGGVAYSARFGQDSMGGIFAMVSDGKTEGRVYIRRGIRITGFMEEVRRILCS